MRFLAAALVLPVLLSAQTSNLNVESTGDMPGVKLAGLTAPQKKQVMAIAQKEPCTCGCGMTLAQCVATDMTCPVRESNVTKIRGMVQRAQNQ